MKKISVSCRKLGIIYIIVDFKSKFYYNMSVATHWQQKISKPE